VSTARQPVVILHLIVTPRIPAVDPPTSHGIPKYRYGAMVDGEVLVEGSDDPEHDLARALLARGIQGRLQIVDGGGFDIYGKPVAGTGKPRLSFDIEAFAPWRLIDHPEKGLILKKYVALTPMLREKLASRRLRAPECHPEPEALENAVAPTVVEAA
jgi:hypothetical protein